MYPILGGNLGGYDAYRTLIRVALPPLRASDTSSLPAKKRYYVIEFPRKIVCAVETKSNYILSLVLKFSFYF